MSLKQTIYSVLIISSTDYFINSISSLLSPAEYSPICTAKSISAAKRETARRHFDFIIINSPLGDETGVQFACEKSENSASAILLFAKSEVFSSFYEKLTPFGVFTINKPSSRDIIMMAFLWLAAARERLRKNEIKTVSIEKRMNEIRVINRAKWLLIENEKLSEAEAHRKIEKQAMDSCLPKIDIANKIIGKYS